MKAKLILFALVFVLTSCNKNEVYDEFNRDFTDNRWESKDVKSFEFENMQSEGVCELKLHFGHISGFQFKEVPLEVEITTPDGKTETLPVAMKLIDDSGKDLGDCSGDVCDVFQTIKTFEKLEKGKYKVAVKSKFTGPYLPNVLGVGILIERKK
ncbi:gliding motility lipoprotein GldH [Flavobacterium lacisediminis]|uniref:Gliding motility lipoprotein GldH n=1 Tax=Flavobacterium lacisediminis TaxID=2989705 RepID=A0ABT3EGB0_9FLAO|nr:gliding motility lipoprotein GldH [Flavobacterium lacisediminis]MCW1147603.1 gliding motility lipoprotein GldH [Flavobacterium lacisediminis]